jgi:hypothetical protein
VISSCTVMRTYVSTQALTEQAGANFQGKGLYLRSSGMGCCWSSL